MEHKMYLAGESREPVYDLSECELTEVPSNLYAQCRIMQKDTLLLHNNFLESLTSSGAKLRDLHLIRVLDLHGNFLQQLPDDIGLLVSLQVLDVSHNKLKQLPANISKLVHLTTLNVEGNQLKQLPEEIGSLQLLQHLHLSDNPISHLPRSLCSIRTIEMIGVTCENLRYPPADAAAEGTESILQYMCHDCGILYEPPSIRLHSNSKDTSAINHHMSHHNTSHIAEQTTANSIFHYEQMKEERRQKILALEKQMQDDLTIISQLAIKANHHKNTQLDRMFEEENRMMDQLMKLHNNRDLAHRQLLLDLRDQEEEAEELVQHLLTVNEMARKREKLMEKMEEERAHSEKWFFVRQEESQSLRRQEVLSAMQAILNETELVGLLHDKLIRNRELTAHTAQQTMMAEESAINAILSMKQINQSILVDQVMHEEVLQKQAFAQLQMLKDSCMQRIVSELDLIENELRKLTLLEVEKKLRKQEIETRVLAEKRAELIQLYQQLQEEKERRAMQLKERMREMEIAKERDQIDYWLIQYQRLLDRKPQTLFDQENQLEKAVYGILTNADALDYLVHFQRHRITIETLYQMNDKDLAQIGVHQFGVRKNILREVEAYKKLQAKTLALELPETDFVQPTAPSSSSTESSGEFGKSIGKDKVQSTIVIDSSAPPISEVQAHIEITCCICLDKESCVLFLSCGHICCCSQCSPTVQDCPLCRAAILQRIFLNATLALKAEMN